MLHALIEYFDICYYKRNIELFQKEFVIWSLIRHVLLNCEYTLQIDHKITH